jgi:molybdopterin-guanine dinucleotide biosynthesis protein A
MIIMTALLAGGKSTRMGTDKALVDFHGRPMLQVMLDKLPYHATPCMIIGRTHPELQAANIKAIPYLAAIADDFPDRGPVGGLVTALRNCPPTGAVLLMPCDVPNTSPIFLDWLFKHARALEASDNPPKPDSAWALVPWFIDHPEPLFAIYSRGVLDTALELLEEDPNASLRTLLTRVDLRLVDMEEEYVGAILDVDTPEDLEAARAFRPMF